MLYKKLSIMRKIIFLLAFTGLLFWGCNNGERGGGGRGIPDVLTGTVWKFTETILDEDEDEYTYTGTISFTSPTAMSGRYTIRYKDRRYSDYDEDHTAIGTYTYDKPVVTISAEGETDQLTVSGKQMTSAHDQDGNYITFKKQ